MMSEKEGEEVPDAISSTEEDVSEHDEDDYRSKGASGGISIREIKANMMVVEAESLEIASSSRRERKPSRDRSDSKKKKKTRQAVNPQPHGLQTQLGPGINIGKIDADNVVGYVKKVFLDYKDKSEDMGNPITEEEEVDGAVTSIPIQDAFHKVMTRISPLPDFLHFARSGHGLGLDQAQDIAQLQHRHSDNAYEMKYQLLECWRKREGHKATVETLQILVKNYFEEDYEMEEEFVLDEDTKEVNDEDVQVGSDLKTTDQCRASCTVQNSNNFSRDGGDRNHTEEADYAESKDHPGSDRRDLIAAIIAIAIAVIIGAGQYAWNWEK